MAKKYTPALSYCQCGDLLDVGVPHVAGERCPQCYHEELMATDPVGFDDEEPEDDRFADGFEILAEPDEASEDAEFREEFARNVSHVTRLRMREPTDPARLKMQEPMHMHPELEG